MSTVKTFMEEMEKDDSLRMKVVDLANKNDEKGLVELAQSYGLSDDVIISELERCRRKAETELTDEELEAVAGGSGPPSICTSCKSIDTC